MIPKLTMIVLTIAVAPIWPALAGEGAGHAPNLLPPVSPACISSSFGPRVLADHPAAGSFHYGVDLPAPLGAAVVATAPGTVVRVQRKGPGGLEMLVQHDGFVAVYSHFGMIMPAFAEGKRTVAAGEKLGVVGRTGVTSGAHLYFEMILAGKPVDPEPYLDIPMCGGAVHGTVRDRADGEGLALGGRRYWQIFLPEPHQQ